MRKQYQHWMTGMLNVALVLGTGLANAQQTDLGKAGQTELQEVTGDAVQTVCGGFVSNGDAVTPDEKDLFDICGEMVHTARVLAGEEPGVPGRTNKSLDLTADELAAALQEIANEETIAPSSLLTETSFGQFGNLFARLTGLRSGVGGLSVSGLNLNLDGRRVQADALMPGRRGGAAGDESAANWGRWGAFINGDLGFGEVDATAREDGMEFDGGGVTAGLDYRINDNAVVGAAGAEDEPPAPNEEMPDKLFSGITVIGKNATVPDGARVGRNVLVNSNRDESHFPADGVVADGKTI